MGILLIILGILFFIIGILALAYEAGEIAFIFGVVGSVIIIFALLEMQYSSKPSAMDVYKGKTTLEITYRDSVPIDSIVVFKR